MDHDSTAATWVIVRYNDLPETGDITVYGPFSTEADAEACAEFQPAQVKRLKTPDYPIPSGS